jgi:small-conductance mechanosensitive channel
MNQMMMKQVNDLESQFKAKESELSEMTKKFKKSTQQLEKVNKDLKNDMSKLNHEVSILKAKNQELQDQLESIKQREIDRLEDTDLEDVDLVSESTKRKEIKRQPPHPLVPSLDLEKMRKMQEEELNKMIVLKNELDEDIPFEKNDIFLNSRDEEFEDPSSIATEYMSKFNSGSVLDSQSEEELFRTNELMMRKAEVINQLNEIYSKEQHEEVFDESEDSGLYYAEDKQYDLGI